MDPTLSTFQRIYLQLKRGDAGRVRMVFSRLQPKGGAMVALLSRGSIASDGMFVDLVSDPTQDETLRGKPGDAATIKVGSVTAGTTGSTPQITNSGTPSAAVFDFALPAPRDGLSAYQLARDGGYGGTQTAWLASLVGAAGKSAYEIARDGGYGGTQTQWLASLKAIDGVSPVLAIGTVATVAAGQDAAVTLTGTAAAPKLNLSIPRGSDGTPATTLLGTVTITESMTVAIGAGLRRVTVTTPTGWNVKSGDDLVFAPLSLPAGNYALHNAIVTAANTVQVVLTVPALALLASYSIPCRVRRLN